MAEYGVETQEARDLRQEFGLARKILARMTGLSERSLASWETGGKLNDTGRRAIIAIDRLLRARASDQPHGYAAISEAVWWVTLVDATLVRYHPDVYDAVLEGYSAAERGVIEGTFGGLRFVRNWMGYHLDHSDFIEPRCTPGSPGAGPIAGATPARGGSTDRSAACAAPSQAVMVLCAQSSSPASTRRWSVRFISGLQLAL